MRYTLADAPFAGWTGAGVTVAVLDSGVHAAHPHVGGVDRGVSLAPESDDHVDRLGHGTAVAAAIREKAPGTTLIAVKIFHLKLATTADTLAQAIEWASDDGARLINLSLGTANPIHAERLAAAIERATSRGTVVISARESSGIDWYPGSLPGVVGVVADPECDRESLEVAGSNAGLPVFRASPYPRPIPNVPRERNVSGVSFAVANVTGFLARALEAGGSAPTADVLRGLAQGN